MRLIKQSIEKDGSGSVTLFPEEPEDMWHAYNLIRPTDLLKASALRRVTTESATGSTSSHRVHTTLLIRVTAIDFDSHAGQLHVSGRIAEENKYVKVGAYHTLDLELQRNFALEKAEGWDSVALDIVRAAIDPQKRADIGAVVMQEGLAHICLITEHQTILRQRVEAPIPRKRGGKGTEHDSNLTKFFQQVLATLQRDIDLSSPKPILLASPGFTATAFRTFLLEEAARTGNKQLLANRANFLVAHASSGHMHALAEVLKSPAVLAQLKDARYARETALMDRFLALLRADDGRAWYGAREVTRAVEREAVGRGGGALMLSNKLFRAVEVDVRKRWVALVDRVKAGGGDVWILSSDHESGKRLEALGDVAALLTFPLLDLDEDVEGEGGGAVEG
ncbi:MAG: Translation factor pelota [Trizodia sp. TS-e1964]|nr:MAG: Translation factor pelota [Trizodia sp. TS-e1964]